jgi:hypothetical protein
MLARQVVEAEEPELLADVRPEPYGLRMSVAVISRLRLFDQAHLHECCVRIGKQRAGVILPS